MVGVAIKLRRILTQRTSAQRNVKKYIERSKEGKNNGQNAKCIKKAQSKPIALYCIPQCKEAS